MEVIGGILVKTAPVGFDRFPHWLRMGGEEEARHVDAIARQIELGADSVPVVEPRRNSPIGECPWLWERASKYARAQQQSRADQEVSAVHVSPSSSRRRTPNGLTAWCERKAEDAGEGKRGAHW